MSSNPNLTTGDDRLGRQHSVNHLQQPLPSVTFTDQLSSRSIYAQDVPLPGSFANHRSEHKGGAGFGSTSTFGASADAVVPGNTLKVVSKQLRGLQQPNYCGPRLHSEHSHYSPGISRRTFPTATSIEGPGLEADMSNHPAGGYGALQYYAGPSGTAGHAGASPIGSMQMVYGSNPMAYPGQMLPQAPLPAQTQMLSPGAIARQQRASADTKRGKRRRPLPVSGAGPASPGTGEAGSTPAQVVPSTAPAKPEAPVVKVKEERRKKRLLRNRVSAQQARERKRQHMTELEEKCQKMEESNAELEDRIDQLTKENEDLRQFVRTNMRSKGGNQGTQPSAEVASEQTIARPRAEVARPDNMAAFAANIGLQGVEMGGGSDAGSGREAYGNGLVPTGVEGSGRSTFMRLRDGSIVAVPGRTDQ